MFEAGLEVNLQEVKYYIKDHTYNGRNFEKSLKNARISRFCQIRTALNLKSNHLIDLNFLMVWFGWLGFMAYQIL